MVAHFLDPLVFTPIDLPLNYYTFALRSNCKILGTKFLILKKKMRKAIQKFFSQYGNRAFS